MKIRPQLAHDADLAEVRYPCAAQPKIDGVRALNLNGTLTGRSLKPFEGFGITTYFSRPEFRGLDGEMTLGEIPNSEDRLCNLTAGAMGRFKGISEMPNLHWWVFDFVTPESVGLPYRARYALAAKRVQELQHPRVHLVPSQPCDNRQQLDELITTYANAGFEGTVIRRLSAPYKEGRPTLQGQELLRVKPWVDFEICITQLVEGSTNENQAEISPLGYAKRSSAKDGLVPNGQVGALQGTLVRDLWVNNGTLCIPAGTPITAGSGNMTIAEATLYYNSPELLLGKIAKIKTMAFGVKNRPRFPVFVSLRLPQDF